MFKFSAQTRTKERAQRGNIVYHSESDMDVSLKVFFVLLFVPVGF